ncbi:MAG: hypothetical protein IJ359_01825 [Erysipelotrichaceae bacterium]|nr:hypothetical protein [Erysipelotrichaceae bacterium]
MNYNSSTKKDFNKNEYFHDYSFLGISYDYLNRNLTIHLRNDNTNKCRDILINSVLYFDMQSCEFWNPGRYVYHIWIEDDCSVLDEYITLLNRDLSFSSHNFKNIQEYMCVILKLNSGDEFRIICKEIIV